MSKLLNTIAQFDAKSTARLNNMLTKDRQAIADDSATFKRNWDKVWSTHNARIPTEKAAAEAILTNEMGYCEYLISRNGRNERTALFFIAANTDQFLQHDFSKKQTRTVRGIPTAIKPSATRTPKADPTPESLAAEWKAIADKRGIKLQDIVKQWQKTLQAERSGFADERRQVNALTAS